MTSGKSKNEKIRKQLKPMNVSGDRMILRKLPKYLACLRKIYRRLKIMFSSISISFMMEKDVLTLITIWLSHGIVSPLENQRKEIFCF